MNFRITQRPLFQLLKPNLPSLRPPFFMARIFEMPSLIQNEQFESEVVNY